MTTKIVLNESYVNGFLSLSIFGTNEYLNKGGDESYLPHFVNKNSRFNSILIQLIEKYTSHNISGKGCNLVIKEIDNEILTHNDCWEIKNLNGYESIKIDYEKIKLYKQIYKLTIENIIYNIFKKNNSYFNMLNEELLEIILININIEHLNILNLSFK